MRTPFDDRVRGMQAVDEINVQKPSLDEVFLTLTGKPADSLDTPTDEATQEENL